MATTATAYNFTNSTIARLQNITSTTPSSTSISFVASTSSILAAAPVTTCNPKFHACSRELQPVYLIDSGTYINPYDTVLDTGVDPNYNATLLTYCGEIFNTSLSDWFATAPITYYGPKPKTTPSDLQPTVATPAQVNATTTAPNEQPTSATLEQSHTSIATPNSVLKRNVTIASTPARPSTTKFPSYITQYTYTASKPCCYSCTITAEKMLMYQWSAHSGRNPGATTFVNSDGFTL